MEISIIVLLSSITVSFFYGLFSRNYSTVDRLWSVLPPVYILLWIIDSGISIRFIIVFVIVLLWGIRLSVNFGLKGGYGFSLKKGFTGEDYRWEILRQKIGSRFLFELFNLFFISGFQLVLIFTFTLPVYYYGQIELPISSVEILLFAIHLLFLAGETAADIQQLRFHRLKKQAQYSGSRRYSLGFNTFGLWRFSRHPNYVCEMGQWVVVFLYLTAASGRLHFSGLGAAVLILLFAGSTAFAENITESKYSEYKEWKSLTSAWLPFKSLLNLKQGQKFLEENQKVS